MTKAAAISSLLLLLLLQTPSSKAAGRSSVGRDRFGLARLDGIGRRDGASATRHRCRHRRRDALHELRGGQQNGGGTPTYHGNYVAPSPGEEPPAAASAREAAVAVAAASSSGGVAVEASAEERPAVAVVAPAAATAPVRASAGPSSSGKLSNLQERTGPAILMLGAVYLLLKFAGSKGLIGLVYLMQIGLYYESTAVVEDYHDRKKEEGGGMEGTVQEVQSFGLQKWWWFATAVMLTSGRNLLADRFSSLAPNALDLLSFGMSSASLVWAVAQLAALSGEGAEDAYRRYLGKVACCHFSLLFLIVQSSYWIKTVREYGLVWVLFPAFLVVVNDTMAYVFGVLLGKHKLLPRLSPKKTVEGFVGAGLSTLAVAGPLLRKMLASGGGGGGDPNAGKHALAMALYASLVSPFGGFLASAVKRAHGAKDFGSLIPGHGGVVDRFDCQVVTAPFVYLYLKNFLTEAVVEAAAEAAEAVAEAAE